MSIKLSQRYQKHFTDLCLHQEEGQDRKLICRQIISSGIMNKLSSTLTYAATQTLLHFTEQHGDYGYDHYDWMNGPDYALIKVDFSNTEKIHYTVSITNEDDHSHDKSSDNANWNHDIQYSSSILCNVL